jgi:hypothetical protein
MELWKPIKSHPHYEVSNLGRVRSLFRVDVNTDGRGNLRLTKRKGKMLKVCVSPKLGYGIVSLSMRSIRSCSYVHLLVAAAFLPPKPKGHEINHKNGNKADARACNLEWKTHQENMIHSVKTGLRKVFSCGHPKSRIVKRNRHAK